MQLFHRFMYIKNNRSLRQLLKAVFIILLLLAVYFRWVNHGWENIVQSDGRGYYAYLPSIITYNDLTYQHYLDTSKFQEDYKNNFLYIIDGHHVIKYPPGVAVMLTPFYLIADVISRVAGFELSGYSFFYLVFVSLGAISYAVIGLYCCIQLLAAWKVSPTLIVIMSFGVIFGTNITNYIIREPSMSHVYSFAAVAAFLLAAKLFIDDGHRRFLIWMGFLFGLIILIRPVNGIVVFSLILLINTREEWNSVWRNLKLNLPRIFMAAMLFLIIVFVQPLLWFLQNGHWYVWTYLDEYFVWDKPEIFNVLFSYRKGWLVYTPFFILLPVSLFYMIVNGQVLRMLKTTLLWTILVYVIASWWCWYYGGSFGQRAFIEFYPIALVSMIPLLNSELAVSRTKIIALFTGCCIFLNLVQSYQYRNNILHYDSMNKSKYWQVFLKTGGEYEWLVFKNQHSEPPEDIRNLVIKTSFCDFEDFTKTDWLPVKSKYSNSALSGNYVVTLDIADPYSPVYKYAADSLLSNKKVLVRGYVNSQEKLNLEKCEVIVVLDDSTGNSYFRQTAFIQDILSNEVEDDWREFNFRCNYPEIRGGSKMVIYIYSPMNKVTLDDLAFFIYN